MQKQASDKRFKLHKLRLFDTDMDIDVDKSRYR